MARKTAVSGVAAAIQAAASRARAFGISRRAFTESVLSVAERDLLDALRAPAPAGEGDVARRGAELVRLSARRRRHGTLATLRTRDLRALLAREAPLRLMTASVLTTRL